MNTSIFRLAAFFFATLLPWTCFSQVNSGSNGSDGALNPTTNLVIDMADHPDGIYQYATVNIPAGVTVSFIPNSGNRPVILLVQGDCTIVGTLNVNGSNGGTSTSGQATGVGGSGGSGGFRGGSAGNPGGTGQGPGGGPFTDAGGGNASYGTIGGFHVVASGAMYGNAYLLPLLGGSGGGGSRQAAGGGGGGAILLAANGTISLTGAILAKGGDGEYKSGSGGGGSGGAIRLVATKLIGSGTINVSGGIAATNPGQIYAGSGRIRLDVLENNFGGSISGPFTQGFQPIIIPAASQGIQLAIQSLAGLAVPASPSGALANPDVIIPAQQTNPIPVVVSCTNIPLNTEISVVVHPATGPDVQVVGLNNSGTLASSTATLSLNMPRGGGIIYAKAVTGITGGSASIGNPADAETRSLAETGWSADGERFVKMEITAALGGRQRVAYITESGKKYSVSAQ